MNDWSAVITAGGYAEGALCKTLQTDHKSLANFKGRTLLQRAVEAVSDAGIERIAVCGDEPVQIAARSLCAHAAVADRGDSPVESASNGIAALKETRRILFLPADTPFIEGSQIADFISRLETVSEEFLAIGVCDKQSVMRALPGAKYRYVRLREGSFATSSLQAGTAYAVQKALDVLISICRNRKSQFAVLRQVGIGSLLKFAMRRLSLHDIERIGSVMFGSKSVLVKDVHPYTTFDIDDENDWQYAQTFRPTD
jgi:CTP:molybdopterin cytidylyltransferase MocA